MWCTLSKPVFYPQAAAVAPEKHGAVAELSGDEFGKFKIEKKAINKQDNSLIFMEKGNWDARKRTLKLFFNETNDTSSYPFFSSSIHQASHEEFFLIVQLIIKNYTELK